MASEKGPLGIVAGGGNFPILCAQAAQHSGMKVVVVAHKGETSREIERYAHAVHWVHLGQLGKVIEALKKNRCTKALFAGSITKKRMFFDVRPDLKALTLWNRLRSRLDDNILRAVSKTLEQEGIEIVPSTYLLKDLLTPKGLMTKIGPTKEERDDISLGFTLQKRIGALDIGQTMVLKDKAVVAIEAIEGTDQTILRGGMLAGPGTVVVKVAKPGQDTRFDLPSTGVQTIKTMIEAKARVLALEAKKSIFFDRDEAIGLADSHGITVVGIEECKTGVLC